MAAVDKKIIDDLKKDSETKGQKIGDLESGLKRTEMYMVGIALVAAFGLITLTMTGWAFFSDSLRFKAATYQTLVDKVSEINEKIDNSNELTHKNEINLLQAQISDLKQNNPYLR